jgi:hydrogenase maturation protease
MSSANGRVTVFLCGEPLRGDDGVAALAGAGLSPETLDGATVRTVRGLATSDLLELPHGAASVVVDAVSGVPPGRLVVRALEGLERKGFPVAMSSHQIPLRDVLALAARLGWQPCGTFLGVGGERFGLGDDPSPAVLDAVPRLRAAIVLEVARLGSIRTSPAEALAP